VTEQQQRDGSVEYNYERGGHALDAKPEAADEGPVAFAAMTGTDVATYTRERPGMSAFALEDGVVYHAYSAYARGLDGLWGMYQWLDRAPKGRNETRIGPLTAIVAMGYFFVWTVFGMTAFPLGVALAAMEMQQPALARAVPIAVGVVVLIAGSLQRTAWKALHLACCREAPGRGRTLPADAGTAWRHGLRLGVHCSHCCVGLMAILLVIGVMDLRAMAVVAAAITVERLAPAGERVARGTGAVVVGAGLFLIARAAGLG